MSMINSRSVQMTKLAVGEFEPEVAFLTKLNNIICERQTIIVKAIASSGMDAPIGFTDMKDIFICFLELKNKSKDDYANFLLLAKALNYHELCHILFTKYDAKSISDFIINKNKMNASSFGFELIAINNALNLLEDQRIETMFSQKYINAKHYFKVLALKFIFDSNKEASRYFLLYGRRFILENPKLIRLLKTDAEKKIGVQIVASAEKIIDEYLRTYKVSRQIELANEFVELMKSVKNPKNPYSTPQTSHMQKEKVTDEEKIISQDIEILLKEEPLNAEKDSNDNSKGDISQEEIQKQIQEDIEETKGMIDITGSEDLIKEIAKTIGASKEAVKEEIQKQMENMDKDNFAGKGQFKNNSKTLFMPEQIHFETMRNLQKQIKNIRNDLDNKTIYHQKKGKIDIRRAMINDDNYKTADFKKYIPSRLNKTKLGVAILLDASGSMNDFNYEVAISSSWAIANALEETGSKVKVYEFSDGYRILKDFSDSSIRSHWGRDLNGGTNPNTALENAYKSVEIIKKKENITNNVVMIMTDGAFDNPCETERITKKFKDKGTLVVLFVVGNANANNNPQCYNKIVSVRTFGELSDNMLEVVRTMQKEVVKSVREISN